MAATAPLPREDSYEEFVGLHAERFQAYLRGVLGRQAEGSGGRIGVEDTLQEALLAIHGRWPELSGVHDEERDRRLYRCLRDAAIRALRVEHGQRGRDLERPRVVPLDFGAEHADEDRPRRERELQAGVMGEMVSDFAADEDEHVVRASLDRGVLVAGLAALSESEAVALLAVDHLGWEQHALAERLGTNVNALRQTLFTARRLFYELVRHAVGVELEPEEHGRLVAYVAGELKGSEKRAVSRHVRHCRSCEEFQRELRVFGRDAVGVLLPLPFVTGAKVLSQRAVVKPATTVGSGTAAGLFAQAGAAKATIGVVGLLALGTGTVAVLGELQDHHRAGPDPGVLAPESETTAADYAAPGGMRHVALPAAKAKATKKTKRPKATRHHRSASTRQSAGSATSTGRQAVPPPSSSAQSQPTPSRSTSSSSPKKPSSGTAGGDDEFFAG